MLKKLSIEHYKGFYEEQSLDFAIPNNKNGSGLTLIVGPNNTGKTTVIESLLFNTNKKVKESERHQEHTPKITIESDTKKAIYTNVHNGSQIKVDMNHNIAFEMIPSRRFWNPYSNNQTTPQQFINSSSSHEVRGNHIADLGAVLKSINIDFNQKEKLNNLLKKVIPHFTNWTIDTNDQGDYVKYQTKTTSHQTNLLGDGIISIFRIAAHMLIENKSKALIIDEPELSLHPSAQKSLSRLISEISKDKQVILCTHSPHFANWQDFINGAKFIRLNKPNDTKCVISQLNNAADYSMFIQDNYLEYQKPQLLDYVAKEILFADHMLFVEGQEDVGLIKKYLIDQHGHLPFEIFGYGVGGYGNMDLFLKLSKDLGLEKVAALYDNGKDTKQCFTSSKETYHQYHFEILPTDDIKDKYDKNNADSLTKEGCFDKGGNLKPDRKEEFVTIINNIINYFDKE